MARAIEAAGDKPIDWLDFDQAMRLLRAARVGTRPWAVLADWCGQGLIETRADKFIHNGQVTPDAGIEAALWAGCGAANGPHLDAMAGSIRWRWGASETDEPGSLLVLGTRFRKDQVLNMVSHVGDTEVAAALAAGGTWLQEAPPIEASGVPVPIEAAAKSSAGRKPDTARWQAFYFCIIELAQAGRLKPECFESANALSEEVQTMMGDGAFSPDHQKSVVGQIFKRFIGG